RSQRRADLQRSLAWTYTGYAAALCCAALAVLPIIDRWQDLPGLARRIHADCARQSLALLDPDETTIAMLDHGFGAGFTILTSNAQGPRGAVSGWFRAHGRQARVLILMPAHAPGPLTRWLERWHAHDPDGEGVAGTLVASGTATLLRGYELPHGRRYALLGPPAVPRGGRPAINRHEHIAALMSQPGSDLSRNLRNRHIQLTAIGGTIGVGLLLGSPRALH